MKRQRLVWLILVNQKDSQVDTNTSMNHSLYMSSTEAMHDNHSFHHALKSYKIYSNKSSSKGEKQLPNMEALARRIIENNILILSLFESISN